MIPVVQNTKRGVKNDEKKSSIVNCFVTLSNTQILLHRFPNHIIGRALLENVSTFTASNLSESYCLLVSLFQLLHQLTNSSCIYSS